MPLAPPFALVIFQIVLDFARSLPQTTIFLVTVSYTAGISGAYHHTWLID
jgi:hypothetical protein